MMTKKGRHKQYFFLYFAHYNNRLRFKSFHNVG